MSASTRINIEPSPSVAKYHIHAKLANLGSTCYFNATLQALFHTTQFVQWLFNEAHSCRSSVCLPCKLKHALLDMAAASEYNYTYRPVTLFALLRVILKNMTLSLGNQEDAHEFFVTFLEGLSAEYISQTALRQSPKEPFSPIDFIWGGSLISTCSCAVCNFKSSKIEPFNCLNLSITNDDVSDVTTALKFFSLDEAVEYDCTQCGNSQGNTKNVKICNPPNVLAISLNRFDAATNCKISKAVPVNYRLHINNVEYVIRSAVVHLGNSRKSGHYYSYCRCPDDTFAVFDDDKEIVRVPFLPLICDNNAYLLIYEQCSAQILPRYSSTPLKLPVKEADGACTKQQERAGPLQVTPIKIIRTKRNVPKTSSTQSSNDYCIGAKQRKVSPLRILRQARVTKATSSQSDHDYFIRHDVLHHENVPIKEPSCVESIKNDGPYHENSCTDGPSNDFDIVLKPCDVPGATLPDQVITKNKVTDLKRWLRCYGFPINGTKAQLVARVQSVMDLGKDKEVVPDIDDGKWFDQKKASQLDWAPSQQQGIVFPKGGWQPFPSVQIPTNFNYGHIYFYLIESMPHLENGDDNTDDLHSDDGFEDKHLDLDLEETEESTLGHHKKFRRGLMYLKSGHVGEVENYCTGTVYFVRSKVRASMELSLYQVQVALSTVSGNIKTCTCQCKQRALGRCSHISATLLYLWSHVKLNGYEAVTCTSRQCEWNQGTLHRNPGKVKEKVYPAYKIDVKRRQRFDPRATSFQLSSMNSDHINSFLAALSGNHEKTRFQFHLKFRYIDYDLDVKHRRRLVLLCRQFLKNLRFPICELIQPTEDNPLHSYEYRELPTNTVFEIPDTGLQSCSDVWKGRRSVLIGASVSHQACHLTEKGAKGFLKSVLWNIDGDPTPAMRYGTSMEPLARETYFNARKVIDPSATISFNLGLHINSSFPAGGCSPDGIIHSEIYNDILIEIKCPFILKKIDPELFDSLLTEAQLNRFPIERDNDGVLHVKKNHKHYYQMQQSMGILNLKEAHLVIFSKFGMIHAEVSFDIELYQEIVTKVTGIHKKYLVPEYFEMRVPRNLNPISLQY